jgi:uncharacterized protein
MTAAKILMHSNASREYAIPLIFVLILLAAAAAAVVVIRIKLYKNKSAIEADSIENFKSCIYDLISNKEVQSMSAFVQHSDVSCLEHCIFVSYYSYRICRFFGLDYRSAARGGLLHDFFLYDWHNTPDRLGLHAFVHPSVALDNAHIFALNDIEKDIIKKHMWPLTVVPPRYMEAFAVTIIDKYSAILEIFHILKPNRLKLYLLVKNFANVVS